MNYTRKRALLACDFCRHRKRRCDGEKPCGTCREAHADCVYKDLPVDRVEPQSSGQGAVVERLTRIEAMLEEQGQRLNDLALGGTSSYAASRSSLQPMPSPSLVAASPASVASRTLEGHDIHGDQAQFLIPYDHSTAAVSLLSLPIVRSLAGDYPKNYFYDIEETFPLPPPLDLIHQEPIAWPPAPDPGTLELLTDVYFTAVHPTYPLFTRQYFKSLYSNVLENGLTEDAETAICLCVWALGSIFVSSTPSVRLPRDFDGLGVAFFKPALRLILCRTVWGFTPDVQICQALLLAASYIAHLGRPLHSWKMVHYASHKFLQLTHKQRRAGLLNEHDDNYLRVFWSCFMIECDRAAELDVVRTGIEPMADKMPLPRTLDPSETDDIIYFVAETAVRRLLNRIHSSLYSSDNSDIAAVTDPTTGPNNISLNKLMALSSELNRQLEEWYSSIPGRVRPPIGTEPMTSERGKILRIRYYAARHIIHRPFVLYVALQTSPAPGSQPTTPQPQYQIPRLILEKCTTCIASCEAYLYNVSEMLDKRSPYLWTFSQSAMAALLMIIIANSSLQLRPFAPDIEGLYAMVVPKIRKWAAAGSSFEAEVKILDTIAARGQFSTA